MKANYLQNIKDKVKTALNFQETDDDYYDDDEEYMDDDYEEEEEEEVNIPKYNFSKPSSFDTDSFSSYGTQQAAKPSSSASSSSYSTPKSNSNIYNMNDAKGSGKLKVTLFVLEDLEDARNVADSMKERNVVIICDMSKISVNEERRVLDFLDGVRYVCNSKLETISARLYLVVPEAAELSGDFFSQVEHPSIY